MCSATIAFCITNLPASAATIAQQPMAQLGLGLIAAVAVLLMICVRIGEKRWAEMGLDLDGRTGIVPTDSAGAAGEATP